jgi:transcriptional regulator with XRE-family HTH domain
MLNDNDLEIYGSCDLKRPTIPLRSHLYHLEPIGIATPYVESLTSFLMRLAESHNLEVNTLVAKKISNYFDQKYLQKHRNKGLSTLFNKGATLNSNGIFASQLSQSLEQLTLRNDLSCLTLLQFKNVFSSRKLLRKSKAWCSVCYEQDRRANATVYEPLLWSFEAVTVCPQHFQPLADKCPHCDRSVPWLTGKSQIGFCSKCDRWLGSFSRSQHNTSESDLTQSIWISQNLGELLSLIPSKSYSIQSDNISKAFNLIIDATCNGNIAEFAKIFGLPKNTVWMWCKGKSVPELRAILTVCYCFDISLLNFTTLEPQAFQSLRINTQRLPSRLRLKRTSPKTFDCVTIEMYLHKVLNDLEHPLTMKETARKLNIDQRIIYSYFPNLCQAISAKYRSHQKQQTAERIQKSCQEVEQAVRNLYQAGEYPSEARVSQLISQPGYFRYQQVRKSLNQAILDLKI